MRTSPLKAQVTIETTALAVPRHKKTEACMIEAYPRFYIVKR